MSAQDNLSPKQFYHASPRNFEPGDMVEAGHPKVSGTVGRASVSDSDPDKVYFTDSLQGARKAFSRFNVYEVEPQGSYGPDAHFPPHPGSPGQFPSYKAGETPQGMAYESEAPLRVVKQVSRRKARK